MWTCKGTMVPLFGPDHGPLEKAGLGPLPNGPWSGPLLVWTEPDFIEDQTYVWSAYSTFCTVCCSLKNNMEKKNKRLLVKQFKRQLQLSLHSSIFMFCSCEAGLIISSKSMNFLRESLLIWDRWYFFISCSRLHVNNCIISSPCEPSLRCGVL